MTTATASMSTKIREPPTWFDLAEMHPADEVRDMQYFTNNFAGMKDSHFKAIFLHRLFYLHRFTPVLTGYIPAPHDESCIKQVMGHEGCWLKHTTEWCGVHFIWYEASLNKFLFWGPDYYSIVKAMHAIRS